MSAYRDALTDAVLCAECDKPIGRTFVGSIETWGHRVNPGPLHHPAVPAKSRIAAQQVKPPTRIEPQPRSPRAI